MIWSRSNKPVQINQVKLARLARPARPRVCVSELQASLRYVRKARNSAMPSYRAMLADLGCNADLACARHALILAERVACKMSYPLADPCQHAKVKAYQGAKLICLFMS